MNKRGQVIRGLRVKLSKTLQNDLITLAKSNTHLTWAVFSKILGVSDTTAKILWRNGRSTIPLKQYSLLLELIPLNKRERFVNGAQTLNENWGQSKGGKIAIEKIRRTNVLFLSKEVTKRPEFAEFVGVVLGDGHISSTGVRITLEYPYEMRYANHVASIIKGAFNFSPIVYPYGRNNEVRVIINSISLVAFLKGLGIPKGDKVKNNIGIPPFIMENSRLLVPCIRGLIDTDGGFFAKDQKRNRFFMEFTSKTPKLKNDTKTGLEHLGFSVSKSGDKGIRVQNQKDVRRLIDVVGPRNPKTVQKLKLFAEGGKFPLGRELKNVAHMRQ